MLQIVINAAASIAVVLQYLLEHFTEKKPRKRLIGSLIGVFAILGIWGSYSYQKSEASNTTNEFSTIQKQYDSLTILSHELSAQLQTRNLTIEQIKSQNDSLKKKVAELSLVAPKLDPSGRVQLSPGVTLASEFEDRANQARTLYNNGAIDEAYKMASDLTKQAPKFGLPYFIMGTVCAKKQEYAKSIPLLKKAISLGLTKDDEAWAYQNLAVVSIQNNLLQDAISYLKKALNANPNAQNSKTLLDKLLQQK
jgi:tetratricopeptide (TPR) repeat protein